MNINENFLKIQNSYLFSNIGKKVREFSEANPGADIIRLGIGDATRPLPPAITAAMHKAVDEMADAATFRGYPPEYGYDFLLEEISKNDFKAKGVSIEKDEIFVSDGAKSDTGNIGDIFSNANTVAVCDPVYPVYVDTNVMCGRAGSLVDGKWSNVIYMPCTAQTGFLPELPAKKADLIYLCFPNNPTGMTMDKKNLQKWVDYANENGSVILYDAAYEAYISDPEIPHSIFELDGAKTCAIEFRSFSKTAGFTGVRCACTIIPKELVFGGVSANALWARRQATKFNGVSYITQRGAEAIYSAEGKPQVKAVIDYYKNNAKTISDGLKRMGYEVYGG
ncbi:MAG: LL-diaminopimelate aminotransferase, partial [Clostridiales bacterium]|nr:LL-diaminopimelate aminotransferase [Clostridiales bacterium]